MSAHTPGPWVATKIGSRDVLTTNTGGCITYLDIPYTSATVQLIAAAPELAELLKQGLNINYGVMGLRTQKETDLFTWFDRVRAALAKAGVK